MRMKTFAIAVGQFLNETIAPTFPVGMMQGAIGGLSAMIAYQPEILQTVVNRFPALNLLEIVKDGEVDVPLMITGIRGYYAKTDVYKVPLGTGKKPPTYDLTAADAERFCALLNQFSEAERQQSSANAMPPSTPSEPPIGGLRTPEQLLRE